MRPARPGVAEERWLVLAARHPALRAAAETPARTGGWKSTSWLSRCLLFVLGVFAATTAGGTFALFPAGGLFFAGASFVGVAEWLISRRRVVRSGFEESLLACGALALAVQLGQWLDLDGTGLALLAGLAFALTGLRLLNPLFTTLGALALVAAVAWEDRAGVATACCGVIALAALVISGRRFERPSHDRMLDGLVIAMPAAASIAAIVADLAYAPLVPLLAAMVCAGVGIRRPSRAPLHAALLCVPCLAWAARDWLPWGRAGQLILWGALVLAAAVVLERWLRRPRGGFVSRRGDDEHAPDPLLQAATAGLATGATTQPVAAEPAVGGEGGGFGGGGASGRY